VTAHGLALGIVCAPFISAALLGLSRAGRALHHHVRELPDRHRPACSATDVEDAFLLAERARFDQVIADLDLHNAPRRDST